MKNKTFKGKLLLIKIITILVLKFYLYCLWVIDIFAVYMLMGIIKQWKKEPICPGYASIFI